MTPPDIAPALWDKPSRLFVEVTSRCNLRCPMCVKQSAKHPPRDGDMAPEVFQALGPAFPHLQALILNGIGEPLLHPRLEACIRAAKDAMPTDGWVGFQTNGHLLDEAGGLSLVDAGLDRIFLSVDATSPELFKTVRGGGSLGHVERALKSLAAAGKARPGTDLEIGAEFVVMRENMRELPALIDWLARRGVRRLVVSHLLPFVAAMARQPIFGVNTDSAELFYKHWAARAQRERLDLSHYFGVLWKFHKNPDELRIVEMVKAMSSQASRNDIPLHVGNLLAGEDLEQAEAVFHEAERAAAAVGLGLTLPSLRPLGTHTCLGVKRGGMFIAWDGKVSPCHFLWRDSSCHVYGREKQVLRKVFGDLADEPLLAIWNKPAYRAFRHDVLRRRYPHCPGCNVYPCEDINSTDFENDCYGETVPCGDCLWSMGLLQCLGQDDEAGELQAQKRLEAANVRNQFGPFA